MGNKLCKCGHMTKYGRCRDCAGKERSIKYIGNRFGKLVILDNPKIDGERKLLVKCDCGKEYYISPATLKYVRSCRECCRKFSVGMILDGIELLERKTSRIWKMKCSCGQIFEKVPKKCRGKYATCGCHWDNYHLKRVKDKVGNSYLLLKVEKILRKENGHYILQMKCKCGNRFERKNGHEFKSGSCGCLISKNNPREDKKGNARFKNYEILSIREFYEAKTYSLEELAEMFNCTPHYIWRIVKGKIWKSLLPASE